MPGVGFCPNRFREVYSLQFFNKKRLGIFNGRNHKKVLAFLHDFHFPDFCFFPAVFQRYDENFMAASLDEAHLDITEVCKERGLSGGQVRFLVDIECSLLYVC